MTILELNSSDYMRIRKGLQLYFLIFQYFSINYRYCFALTNYLISNLILNLLIPLIKETMVADAIAWHLIDILHLVSILMRSAAFIKEFFILCVIEFIVLRIRHIGSIIPCGNGT